MISIEEAKQILSKNVQHLSSKVVKLEQSANHVLFKNIYSPVDQPLFNQSAMDGYALNFDPTISKYEVIGEVAAGSSFKNELLVGQAVRIFTGAMVPDSATTVVPQELVHAADNFVTLMEPVKKGKHIRYKGEQIKKGLIAMEEGERVSPAAIGFLASLGITEVDVYSKPKVAIIITGSELVQPGQPLALGQIYESNAAMLTAALVDYNFKQNTLHKVPDNLKQTIEVLRAVMQDSDLVLFSGGISVGDYDYVKEALLEVGTKELFYKVNQKPGKPLFAGECNNTMVLALPGNPAAALTCFYQYALPTLNKLMGKPFAGLKKVKATLQSEYIKKGKRAVFLKAIVKNGQVQFLEGQSSAMLKTFSDANALAYLPADLSVVRANESVTCYLL